jgi:ABC-2 type transport system ATP-binding protein
MLEATGLAKSYGTLNAVDGISISLRPGEIVGLLGPNGAGKTTTVSMLCGLATPDRGTVTIAGEPMDESAHSAKRHVGLVPQEIALYEELGAEANLRLMGALYGVEEPLLTERVNAALVLVGLADRARDKPSKFSGGMKRRLNIACALVHDPAVLLLDEPTVGVDPQSRNAIFDNLESLRDRGKALLYTTHYMEEAERLCDRIVIVDHGKVIASDTRENLLKLGTAPAVPKGPSLESVFLQLTGRDLRDHA